MHVCIYKGESIQYGLFLGALGVMVMEEIVLTAVFEVCSGFGAVK